MAFDANGNLIDEDSPTAVTTDPAPVTSGDETPAPENGESETPPAEELSPEEAAAAQELGEIDDEGKPKISKAVRELISQRKKRQALELENERLKGQLEGKSATAVTAPAIATVPSIEKPLKPADFDTWEDYNNAVLDREKAKLRASVSEEVQKTLANQSFTQQINETAKVKPQVREALQNLRTTPTVAQFIREASENPGELAIHLYNNPAELNVINNMPPIMQVRELSRIEGSLVKAPVKATRTISQAPAPIKPSGASGITPTNEETMSDEQWMKHQRDKRIMAGRKK